MTLHTLFRQRIGSTCMHRLFAGASLVLCCLALLLVPAEARPERAHLLLDRGKSSASFLRAFSRTTTATRESIVQFEVDNKPAALGTVVADDGLVLTKASEISSTNLTCKVADGPARKARLIAVDEENDLALVQVDARSLKPVRWEATDVQVGQWVITPGLDASPEAVGIVSVHPRKILPKQAFLGVVLDHREAEATIAALMPGGLGAEKAGLKAGDVILAVNDKPVKNSDELMSTVRAFREGQTVKLRYRRDTTENTVEIELATPKRTGRWRGFSRQDRMNHLGGELSRRAEGFQMAIQHDTVLQPWQCGGPLLDLDGRAVGLNIARAGRVASYALPATLVQKLLAELEHDEKAKLETVGEQRRSENRP